MAPGLGLRRPRPGEGLGQGPRRLPGGARSACPRARRRQRDELRPGRPGRAPGGAGRRAGGGSSAGHQPGQRPLPDRLRRDQRSLPLRRRGARLPHRLPLHRARGRGGRGLGGGDGRRRLVRRARRAPRGEVRVRGRPPDGAGAAPARGGDCPRAPSWSPAAGAVERLRRVKDEAELEAIAAAARLADEVYALRPRARAPRAHRGTMSPPPRSPGSASWAPSPRSRRSSPPAPTGRSRTPSRARGRSGPASWSSSTWAPSSTATAPTAPAPSPPARSARPAAEVYELVRSRPGSGRWRRSRPAPRARPSTPSPAR